MMMMMTMCPSLTLSMMPRPIVNVIISHYTISHRPIPPISHSHTSHSSVQHPTISRPHSSHLLYFPHSITPHPYKLNVGLSSCVRQHTIIISVTMIVLLSAPQEVVK